MIGHHVHRKRSPQNRFCVESQHRAIAKYGDTVTAPVITKRASIEAGQKCLIITSRALSVAARTSYPEAALPSVMLSITRLDSPLASLKGPLVSLKGPLVSFKGPLVFP